MRQLTLASVFLALAACTENPDPAAGGFFDGISGIASGSYEARTAAEAEATADAKARNDALRAEQASLSTQIASAEAQLAQAKLTLLRQRDANPSLPADTRARVNRALLAEPAAGSDAARLADLQALLTETKALSADLAGLSV